MSKLKGQLSFDLNDVLGSTEADLVCIFEKYDIPVEPAITLSFQ